MRNFFTQLFLVVLMVTLFGTSGYAVVLNPTLWPADNSTNQLQPSSVVPGQTFTITFAGTNPSNTVQRLRDGGIISINLGPLGTGIWQQQTLRIGTDAGIVLDGNTIRVNFPRDDFAEDTYYFITVSQDAIQFMDGSFFGGLGYSLNSDFDLAADWGFKVKDVHKPQMVTCTTMTIRNGQRNVGVDENVVYLCFNEPVNWKGGTPPVLKNGDIAFYHATNPTLDNGNPSPIDVGEFGGDVLYAKPAAVGFNLFASPDDVSSPFPYFDGFTTLPVYVKYTPNDIKGLKLKYDAIGDDVWPKDADIYMRFLAGLLVDKDGNTWDGTSGSPFDIYTVAADRFWFTTRSDAAVTSSIWQVQNNTVTPGHSPLLWNDDDFIIRIDEDQLKWIAGANMGSFITPTNATGLITLEVNGVSAAYTILPGTGIGQGVWENGEMTYIAIHPTLPFPSDAAITVSLVGGLVWDLDRVVVGANHAHFTAGDFDAPVFQTSINNVLCTNFDIRAWNSDENAVVYYALIDDSIALLHPGWNDANVKIEDIYNGYMDVNDIGPNPDKETRVYFNHVADPAGVGPYTYGNGYPTPTWQPDSFLINTTLTAFEHVDDFVAPNHGKIFRVFYFGTDPTDQGPFAAGFETSHNAQATGVSKYVVTLSDCLPPEHALHFEGVNTTNDPLYDPCGDQENIKKKGSWSFQVPTTPAGIHVDELFLVNTNLSWGNMATLIASGVFRLDVSAVGPTGPWTTVPIASIVYANNKVIVTPLNSYPSAGWAKITLLSGSIMDKHGNAINQELSCVQQVESYCDPYIKTLTVQTRALLFPSAPEAAGLNGVVALRNGQITIEFNNPMFTPKRDVKNSACLNLPLDSALLIPIVESPVTACNWVGNYIKVRRGTPTDANNTNNIVNENNFTYTVTRSSNGQGGITGVVLTPLFEYDSEIWYYVEVEKLLQDENSRELSWINGSNVWDNNTFIDPHHQYAPYTWDAEDACDDFPEDTVGNSANYFMKFKAEDRIAPTLQFTFNKFEFAPPVWTGPLSYPYIAGVDENLVSCVDRNGVDTSAIAGNQYSGFPVGVIINEWSKLGFDDVNYFTEVDPNGLRPYFTLTNTVTGLPLDFDIVVLDLITPNDINPVNPYVSLASLGYRDAVWFGFRPFTPLAEGVKYSVTFNPNYLAPPGAGPGTILPIGPVFRDDSGNALTVDTFVEFITCVTDNTICLAINSITPNNLAIVPSRTPNITLGTSVLMEDIADPVTFMNSNPFIKIETKPSKTSNPSGPVWESHDSRLFFYDDVAKTIRIPWTSFLHDSTYYSHPADTLLSNTWYRITVVAGQFRDRNNETLTNCIKVDSFKTADVTPPGISCLSPDIDYNVGGVIGTDSPGTYNLATAIDARNPGQLTICFNEKVTLTAGKRVEVWQNGDTRRITFIAGTDGSFNSTTNTWSVTIPGDQLYYPPLSHYCVDVQAGFVVDLEGNPFPGMGGWEDRTTPDILPLINGLNTWTFQTGADPAIIITANTPTGIIDPYSTAGYSVVNDSVAVSRVTLTTSEGANAVPGKQIVLDDDLNSLTVYAILDAAWFTPNAARTTWTYNFPVPVKVPYNRQIDINVAAGAFVSNWGTITATPLYAFDAPASVAASQFKFLDNVAPTVLIWPSLDSVSIPFNTHAYIKFSEAVTARDTTTGSSLFQIVTQQNLKSWIKVYKGATGVQGTDTLLAPTEYVCEFIDLERKHVRVTFLDEDAPAIGGQTANLVDETRYKVFVKPIGDGIGDTGPVSTAGYALKDPGNNVLVSSAYNSTIGRFWTEDITAPEFYATTCEITATSVKVWFTPWANINPHLPTLRTYPAEAGTVYYIVLPASATAPSAAQLFPGSSQIAGVASKYITGPTSVSWTLPASTVPPLGGYNFRVYAVMVDDEKDHVVPPGWDNNTVWIKDDAIFSIYGDFPIGVQDIRPAPNYNMSVKSWGFCACDDDKPVVVSKQYNGVRDVPVNATFKIKFNELVAFGPRVNPATGIGTGGIPLDDPNNQFGYEVRLRKWNNNVADTISIAIASDSSMVITPSGPLDEETHYYIEIDRFVIRDPVNSNCQSSLNVNVQLPAGFQTCSTGSCGLWTNFNYFDGWVGRTQWEFNTKDNTPPVLIDVFPRDSCVANNNNFIQFKFREKNGMQIKTLSSPSNNIYIYKAGNHAIPFEIIPASSGVIAQVNSNTFTITYPTYHVYNSEERYDVEWNQGLFKDLANWPYSNGTPSYTGGGVVVTNGGDAGSPWDRFSFRSKDNVIPTINWAIVDTRWQWFFGHPEYVYKINNGQGSWNPNDLSPLIPSPKTINECGTNSVPNRVAFYVWTSEDVVYTEIMNADDPFYLEYERTPGEWVPMSISAFHGEGPATLFGYPGGISVTNDWWLITPLVNPTEGLDGNTRFRFGIVGATLEDTSAWQCTPTNIVSGQELFNFCTYNTEPAEASLTDACLEEINPDRHHRESAYHRHNYHDRCICTGAYFDLCFDKVVVKTSWDNSEPPINPPFFNFFSTENMLMTEADLMDTDNGHYIDFREEDGDAVVLDSVQVLGLNGDCGCPQPGVLCYRLWVHGGLQENTDYEFRVQENVLKDLDRIPDGNLFPGQHWEFKTKWNSAPHIDAIDPADEATNVSPDHPLQITFNRDVVAGPGHIVVRDNGHPQGVILNVAGDSANVTIHHNVVTISHPTFDKFTTYYVEVMPDFVRGEDCDMVPFAGTYEQGLIDDYWNFTTSDLDGPIASLWPNQNPNDFTAPCVAPYSNLIMTFDENIEFDTDCGELVIYKAGTLNQDGSPSNSVFGDVVKRIPFNEDNNPQIVISGTDPANGLSANKITVIPVVVFESGATYYIRIEGNGVDCESETNILTDVSGNEWYYPSNSPLPGIHYNDWWFKIADDSAPVLVSTTPVRDATLAANQDGTGVTTDLTMTFDMDVLAGDGKIQIWEFIVNPNGGVPAQQEHKWLELDVQAAIASGKITISDNVVTIHNVFLLDGIDWYYVLAQPGVFTSTVPCIPKDWLGIDNPDEWLFSTAPDNTCPSLTANIIDSDALDVLYEDPASVTFELTFSENVSLLFGSQVAQILQGSTVVASATITPAMVHGNKINMSIHDFNHPLVDQSAYTLFIPSNSITDMASNSTHNMLWPVPGEQGAFFGNVPVGHENFMCADVSIPFATGDFTAPVITSFSPTVTCLENQVVISVKFSEPVLDGPGLLRLVSRGAFPTRTFNAADDTNPNDSIVEFTTTLPDESDWYIIVDSAFVTDRVYMGSVDGTRGNVPLSNPTTWRFSIDDNTVPTLVSWATPAQTSTNLMTTFDVVITYDDVITVVDSTKAGLTVGGNPISGVRGAVLGPNSNQVTVHVVGVADRSTYTLVLAAGFVQDNACNKNASLAGSVTPLIVGDRTKPIVENWGPKDMQTTYIGVQVMVDFFDNSTLTVQGPITIANYTSADVLISSVAWTPASLDANQAATTLPALWFGKVIVTIPAGTVRDANGNVNDAFTWTFWITDNTPPGENCLTIVSPIDGAAGILSQPNLVMDFCERMAACATNKYVNVYELNSTGSNVAVAKILVTPGMINGTRVTIPLNALTIRPDYNTARPGTLKDNQDYIVMADAGSICDEAGNAWVGISDPTKWNWTTGDNTPPTATLTANGVNKPKSFAVVATFTEPVVGATTLITVTGAVSNTIVMSAGNTVATINIVANDLATVVVTVPTTITDVPVLPRTVGNPLVAAVVGTYVVGDNTGPTVTATAPADPQLNTFAVVLDFNEPVKGVAAALTVTNGTKVVSPATDGATQYTVTITAAEEATVVLVLNKDTVKDMSVNANALQAGLNLTYHVGDHVVPTYTVTGPTGPAKRPYTVDIAFSEAVVGVEAGVTVTGATSWSIAPAAAANTWRLTITAPDYAVDTVKVAASITDGAPNFNRVAAGNFRFTVGDNTPPTVAVTAPANPQAKTFNVTLTFSEGVNGVKTDGVLRATNGTITNIAGADGGTTYIVTLTGAEQAEVTLDISTLITDLAGNRLAAPVSRTYTIGDFTAPIATAMSPTGDTGDNTKFDLKLTLNELVGRGTGTMVVYKGDVPFATFTPAQVIISGYTVKVAVSLDKYTTYWIYVSPGFVKDQAGNPFGGITLPSIWRLTTGNFTDDVTVIPENIQFKVYPNPFNDYIKIDNADKLSRVVISNIAGQSVIDVMYPGLEVRTPNLVSGVYVVTLFTEDGIVKTERIVKR